MPVAATSDILFERRGAAGLIILNRPHALNAVTHEMVRAMAATLVQWRDDLAVTRVVITAAGDRAFSAGGDIRALHDLGKASRHEEALAFWRDEYPLNALIKHYPKPYVALIDGLVMGGGFGVSMHGSHRVAGDRFRFAMPEVGIGFFPDVGATYLLPRIPGEIGTFIALTGERMSGDEAAATGIATHRVPSARFSALAEALSEETSVDAVLAAFAEPAGEAPILARRSAIARFFAHDWVEDILTVLDAEAGATGTEAQWAATIAATVRTKSPLSLKIALRQMRLGPRLTFTAAMRTEFRIVSRIVRGHDFYEGVRAVIIDKDNTPRWRPADLAAVSEAEVERHFAPLGAAELDLV
ncbi:MAG TPA: enoyl-CoA hydratase/isomerase family protein [Burkholderiales bacterium]|nr:enoyl-CoA hydratase/isomerase family protein [Burkholderiales bacterium]